MTPYLVLLAGFLTSQGEVPPRVEFRVSGSFSDTSLKRGWAATIEAEIVPAEDGALTLAGQGAAWTDSVTLICRDAGGKTFAFPTKLATEKTPTLTLDAEEHGLVTWYLEEVDTAKLDGVLTLSVVVDTASSTTGWRGRVASNEVKVAIVEPPAPTPESADQKMAAATFVRALKEGEAKALVAVEAFLKSQPDAYACLEMKGDLLMALEKPAEAYRAYSAALKVFVGRNPKAEPPMGLLEKRKAAEDASGLTLQFGKAIRVLLPDDASLHL